MARRGGRRCQAPLPLQRGCQRSRGPCSPGAASGDPLLPGARGSEVARSTEKAWDSSPALGQAAGLCRAGRRWLARAVLSVPDRAGASCGGGGHAPQMPACFPWDLGPPACVWCPCSDVETHTGEQRAPWVPLADRYEPAPPAAAAAGLGPLGHTASFSREPLWGSLGGLGSDVPTATCPLASLEGEVPGVQRTVKVHRPWAGAVLSLLGIQAVLRLRLPAPKAVEAASRQAGAGPASWGAAGPSPRSPPSYASGHSPAGLDPEGRAGCRQQGRGELVVGLVLVMASETHFPCAPE